MQETSDTPITPGNAAEPTAEDLTRRRANHGPAHEGSRSDSGGSYGDFSRADKAGKFDSADENGSVAATPTVLDVEEVFGSRGQKASDDAS